METLEDSGEQLVELIEERKMISRFVKSMSKYTVLFIAVYLISIIVPFIIGFIVENLHVIGIIIMLLLMGTMNILFVFKLCNTATEKAFDSVKKVNSKITHKKMVRISSVITGIFVVIMIVTNIVVLHSLFSEEMTYKIDFIESSEDIFSIRKNVLMNYGILAKIEPVNQGDINNITKYRITNKVYPTSALITFGLMIAINIAITVLMGLYESKLLKKYLIKE